MHRCSIAVPSWSGIERRFAIGCALSAWHLEPEHYPDFNDSALFKTWFETEFFDMVADALDEPLTNSE